MQLQLALSLPRDGRSVPVARRVVHASLELIGVDEVSAHEIAVVLSEACTNVLHHAEQSDEYEVDVQIEDDQCTLRVTDLGQGFDETAIPLQVADDAESGRGLLLIRALVDDLRFGFTPEEGTAVRLVKRLRYADPSLLSAALEPKPVTRPAS